MRESIFHFLLIDDDERFRSRLTKALMSRGHRCSQAENGEQGLEVAERERPDRVVLDLRMPVRGGMEILEKLREMLPQTQVLILTGYATISTAVEALKHGAVHFLPKPAHADSILAAFEGSEEKQRFPELPVPTLEQVEWDHLQRVLDQYDGNITLAAKALKMHRRSLQRKLSKAPKLK